MGIMPQMLAHPYDGRMTTYGFIGAGNMASAIVRGMVAGGTTPADVTVTDSYGPAAEALAASTGVTAMAVNADVVRAADVVVLAVKPQVLPSVVSDLKDVIGKERPLVVSIAAGVSLDSLGSLLPDGIAAIRVMPNVNAQIGAGMAAVAGNAHATDSQVGLVVDLFGLVGKAITLAEKDFPVYSAIAGAAPALTYQFIDALARGALAGGIPKALAVEIAAQTVLGSAQLVLAKLADGVTPASLVDTVTSPGGTTIAGIVAAEEAGFTPSVVTFVRATADRDRALGG